MGNADSAPGSADSANYYDSAPSTLQYAAHHQRKPINNPSHQRPPMSHHHHHHHHNNNSATHPKSPSHPLDKENGAQPSPHQSMSSIKVLPKLNENPPPGLRTTNNGLILHNGGTLSARRGDLPPTAPVALTRAHPPQQRPPPSTTARAIGGKPAAIVTGLPPLMKRSRTQHDMLPPSSTTAGQNGHNHQQGGGGAGANGWAANSRRYHHNQMRNNHAQTAEKQSSSSFGSESDLTTTATTASGGGGDQQPNASGAGAGGGLTKSSLKAISRAHMLQSAAPPLPLQPSVKKYSAPQPPTAFVAPVPRKLRMFKTKAESRKSAVGGATAAAPATASSSSAEPANRESTLLNVRRAHSPPGRYVHTGDKHHNDGNHVRSILPRISGNHQPANPPSAAQMQASYLRREKSFDLNLLRAHHNDAQSRRNHHHEAATESTSGSVPIRTDFQQELMAATERKQRDVANQRSKLPVRSRQMLQPQLLGLIDLDQPKGTQTNTSHHSNRFHVSAKDENNNSSNLPLSYNLATTTEPQDSILDEYLTKSIQLDAIARFTDALHHLPPVAATHHHSDGPMTPAERYMSPPIVADDDFEAHSSSSASGASDTTASSCLSFRGDLERERHQHHTINTRQAKQINITVRPTLPRRQFDIPRFNPAEAWRSLNDSISCATLPSSASRDAAAQMHHTAREEHIVRPPLNRVMMAEAEAQRLLYDSSRSAESGISSGEDLHQANSGGVGDAKMVGVRADGLPSTWTPQQDLGDDDDDDDDGADEEMLSDCMLPAKAVDLIEHFYPEVTENITRSRQRNHCSMFSLSLPRDTHMTSSTTDAAEKPGYNSLKTGAKPDTTVNELRRAATTEPVLLMQNDDNWLLSSSAPNSLDFIVNGGPPNIEHRSAVRQRSQPPPMSADARELHQPISSAVSLKYFSSGPHVMCLPVASVADTITGRTNPETTTPGSPLPGGEERGDGVLSTTSANVSSAPATLLHHRIATKINHHHHHHRFTFQSTVRQIERRRLAERLSHEAALKEAQRRSELESMQRVEEEFQRKRSREKSQQQQSYQSLPATASSDRVHQTEDESRYQYDPYTGMLTDNIVDTHSPYIGRLIEQKSGGRLPHQSKFEDDINNIF